MVFQLPRWAKNFKLVTNQPSHLLLLLGRNYTPQHILCWSLWSIWSHMTTSNTFSVQNQWAMTKLKFFVKEVYTSGMLTLEIMAKKSTVQQYRRNLCKSQEKNYFSHRWKSRCSAPLSGNLEVTGSRKFIKSIIKCIKHSEGRKREVVHGKTSFLTRKQKPGLDSLAHASHQH